jgi:3-oxoacyl-[acyl-carrier-protein] synthase II
MDRSGQLFHAACTEAWQAAGLSGWGAGVRAGLVEGSSLGPMCGVLEDHARALDDPRERNRPSRLTRFMTGVGGAVFAQVAGLRGPVLHLSAGSVSATCAIGEAFQRIEAGWLDVVVAGGAETPLHPEIIGTFASSGVLSPVSASATPCLPFDARRSGTVLGEGAAALVIERADHARSRGARPVARISGYGICTEAFDLTAPDPSGSGVVQAVRDALGPRPASSVGWIKSHGTGTRQGDAAEVRALHRIFGDALSALPMAALKPALGHCLGASGGVEAAATLAAMEQGFVPATVGFRDPDPELPESRIAAGRLIPERQTALLLSESFGGRCAALVLEAA